MNYLILGLGKSGQAAADILLLEGQVWAFDDQKAAILADPVQELVRRGLKIVSESSDQMTDQVFEEISFVVVSPGISADHPWLQRATALKIPITSESEIAFQRIRKPIIAITGTNGKTTTTTLVGKFLTAAGLRPFVGGNIGRPLIELLRPGRIEAYDVIVAELSSYQIERIQSLVPTVAVFTNLSPNHMNRYPSFEAYGDAKLRLRQLCRENSIVVLNADSSDLERFARGPAKEVLRFSSKRLCEVQLAILVSKRTLQVRSESASMDINLSNVQIPGLHNLENIAAAVGACLPYCQDPKVYETVLRTFSGVPHRMETVFQSNTLTVINDSKSTTVQSLITALEAVSSDNIVLLVGGRDKAGVEGSDFSGALQLIEKKCTQVFIFGESREYIYSQLSMERQATGAAESDSLKNSLMVFEKMEDAVVAAKDLADKSDSKTQITILLSPACASQDQFQNFEHRGDVFKRHFLN